DSVRAACFVREKLQLFDGRVGVGELCECRHVQPPRSGCWEDASGGTGSPSPRELPVGLAGIDDIAIGLACCQWLNLGIRPMKSSVLQRVFVTYRRAHHSASLTAAKRLQRRSVPPAHPLFKFWAVFHFDFLISFAPG